MPRSSPGCSPSNRLPRVHSPRVRVAPAECMDSDRIPHPILPRRPPWPRRCASAPAAPSFAACTAWSRRRRRSRRLPASRSCGAAATPPTQRWPSPRRSRVRLLAALRREPGPTPLTPARAVTEPCSTGLGGDCFALYFDATSGKVESMNGSGRCSGVASLAAAQKLAEQCGTLEKHELPPHHAMTVTVPGAAAGWCDTLKRWGSVPPSTVLQPAIALASDGFPVSEVTADHWARQEHLLRRDEGGGVSTRRCSARARARAHSRARRLCWSTAGLQGRASCFATQTWPACCARWANPAQTDSIPVRGGWTLWRLPPPSSRRRPPPGRVAEAIVDVVQRHGGDLTAEVAAAARVRAPPPAPHAPRPRRI